MRGDPSLSPAERREVTPAEIAKQSLKQEATALQGVVVDSTTHSLNEFTQAMERIASWLK